MTNEFVKALRAEIAALEKSLEGDPRYKKLRRLLAALDAYVEADEDEDEDDLPSEKSRQHDPRPGQQSGRARAQKTQEIIDIAAAIIKGRQDPTSTSELLREIYARNVAVHGQKPLNNLSAILSYSGLFQSNGRAGWTLKEQARTENETADDTHLENGSPAASSDHRLTSGGTPSRPVEPEPGGGT